MDGTLWPGCFSYHIRLQRQALLTQEHSYGLDDKDTLELDGDGVLHDMDSTVAYLQQLPREALARRLGAWSPWTQRTFSIQAQLNWTKCVLPESSSDLTGALASRDSELVKLSLSWFHWQCSL